MGGTGVGGTGVGAAVVCPGASVVGTGVGGAGVGAAVVVVDVTVVDDVVGGAEVDVVVGGAIVVMAGHDATNESEHVFTATVTYPLAESQPSLS